MRRILVLFALAAALVAAGCGGDDNDNGGSSSGSGSSGGSGYGSGSSSGAKSTGDQVKMVGTSFTPSKLTANVGDKITWRNDSDLPHNVVAEKGASFKSDTFNKGGTFTFTPEKAGTITYQCTIHPGMTGEIDVKS